MGFFFWGLSRNFKSPTFCYSRSIISKYFGHANVGRLNIEKVEFTKKKKKLKKLKTFFVLCTLHFRTVFLGAIQLDLSCHPSSHFQQVSKNKNKNKKKSHFQLKKKVYKTNSNYDFLRHRNPFTLANGHLIGSRKLTQDHYLTPNVFVLIQIQFFTF